MFIVSAAITLGLITAVQPAYPEAIPVHQLEGSLHGFLILQTLDAKTIGEGDLIETSNGATVKVEMVLHFHDGSYYQEISEFSQNREFRLLNSHLVQKGPSFKISLERSIDASTGDVVVHYIDDQGKQKTESQRLDLPADLANGMFLILLKNIDPSTTETSVSAIGGEPKPRLVKVTITAEAKAPFLIGKSKREATEFDLKPKIEGVAGAIAPLVGKQPADTHVWVLTGAASIALKSEGPLEPEGPVWRIASVGPVWPQASPQAKDRNRRKTN